jgi:hypothetical protein
MAAASIARAFVGASLIAPAGVDLAPAFLPCRGREFEEGGDIDTKGARQTLEAIDRDVGDAALDLGNVGAMEVGEFRELFLAEGAFETEATDVAGNALAGGRCGIGFLGHESKNDDLPHLLLQTDKLLCIHLNFDRMEI